MGTYLVKRVVTLEVEANSRKDAVRRSQGWDGYKSSYSSRDGAVEWDLKSKLLSARVKK